MCRNKGQRTGRCDANPEARARAAWRKRTTRRAAKAGVSREQYLADPQNAVYAATDPAIQQAKDREAVKALLEKPVENPTKPISMFGNDFGDFDEVLTKKYEYDHHLDQPVADVRPSTFIKGEPNRPTPSFGFKGSDEVRSYSDALDINVYIETVRAKNATAGRTERENFALQMYSGNTFEEVNGYLRGKTINYNDTEVEWHETGGSLIAFKNEQDLTDIIGHMDNALAQRSSEKRTLYRGLMVGEHSGILKNPSLSVEENKDAVSTPEKRREICTQKYMPGQEVVFDSYISTTEAPEIAVNWGGASGLKESEGQISVIYELRTNAGVQVADLSYHKEERETLMPRGLRFKVADSYWVDPKLESRSKYSYTQTLRDTTGTTASQAKNNIMVVQLIEVDEHGESVDTQDAYQAPVLKKLDGVGK